VDKGLSLGGSYIGNPSLSGFDVDTMQNLYFLWSVAGVAHDDPRTIGGKDWYGWGGRSR
jgi:hypothetical protein